MAREPSVLDTERFGGDGDEPSETGSNTGLLDRRSYMKLAGATAAAAAFTGTASGDEEYEVIEASGQTIQIGEGETFENTLIDVSTGNGILLNVTGSGATIRNVGFSGLYQGGDFAITINVPSGDVLVENVYLGDGANKSGASFVHGPGAIFLHRDSNADVTFRNCNVQGWPNNGFYCSNTANGGSVRFESCYGKNNGVSTFRAASAEDVIVDCVAYNDDTDYSTENGSWGGYTEQHGRPVWAWSPGPVTIENSEFAAGPYAAALLTHEGGTIDFRSGAYSGDTQGQVQLGDVTNGPALSVPEGVPTSAEEAASGGRSRRSPDPATDEETELPTEIRFEGEDSTATRYEFAVDGEVAPAGEDPIDDGTVHGIVGNWTDVFRFDGDLELVTADGPAAVVLDGEAVDPDEYGPALPHVLEVEGTGEPASYEITVDGTIEAADEADAPSTSGSTVQDSVTDDSQRFRYSGVLTDVTFTEGEARVLVDGGEVDPDEYGDQELLSHALVIDGTEADGPSTYSFTIDGEVVKSEYRDASIDDGDVIEGATVRGSVADWIDAYWFEGEITAFQLDGDADVDVQYNARNQ
ncbi:hypothetical protein [Natronococcus occultus]|uniref:Right handed beta helix domain-containing protein n=1 Tax=Natronococcus occultus SP4 TaxID=694430 RepID=L0K4T6_9EURY|nr:hypothetical protein [Natronococcus occultus]AGB39128.1 hypothetical protein Natoc_3396 [Natronococcus occultus SP4]